MAAEAAGFRGDFRAVELGAPLGHEIDDAEKGAAAVDRGARPADDFDAVDRLRVDGVVAPEINGVVDVVVRAMAIDQHEDAAVVVSRSQKSPRPEV